MVSWIAPFAALLAVILAGLVLVVVLKMHKVLVRRFEVVEALADQGQVDRQGDQTRSTSP